MDVFRDINVSEKLNVFRLVQLPFLSVGSAWRYGGLPVLRPLMSGTWASADLEIFTKRNEEKGFCSQSPRDTGGRL